MNTHEQKIAELAIVIKHHDHYYNMSDDHRVYSSGRAERDHIMSELEEMFSKRSEQLEFWNEHAPDKCGYIQSYIDELKEEGN